jgi:hypothetical protein
MRPSADRWSPTLRGLGALVVGMLFAVGLLLVPSEGYADTQSDFQIWTAFFATDQLFAKTPSLTFWFDAHARRSDPGSVLILRPGLGYAFTPWFSVWAGYAWNPVWSDATGERNDVRGPWEQFTFDHHVRRLTFQSRTRFEQFWSDVGDGMYPRLRQFVRTNVRPKESVPVGVALWDEAFFGLKSTSWADAGFFENRAFAGLAIFTGKTFRVEPGYMLVNVKRGSTMLLGHTLAINMLFSFKPKVTGAP